MANCFSLSALYTEISIWGILTTYYTVVCSPQSNAQCDYINKPVLSALQIHQ